MTTITMRLPIELANAIYSFVGKSPVATIIKDHFEKGGRQCECDLCGDFEDEKYYMDEARQCEMCYVKENPHLDTGLGRNCDVCQQELRMYKWVRIYGDTGGEFCMDCYERQHQIDE